MNTSDAILYRATHVSGPVVTVPMRYDKDGNGPASLEDTATVKYQVWDMDCRIICECDQWDDALMIATLLNSPGIMPTR